METASTYNLAHVQRTLPAQEAHTQAPYPAHAIASRYPDIAPSEVTVRTRWFEWLTKVAPEQLLKTEKGSFTELAAELFDDFAQAVKRDKIKPDVWVASAKSRYSQEWESVGIIEAELMPDEVGGTLALMTTQNSAIETKNQQENTLILELIEQLGTATTHISESERQQWAANGKARGQERFKTEVVNEQSTYNDLKQKLANLQNQS